MATIRSPQFVTGYYYHVFNRGVERRSIFTSKDEYSRFVKTCIYYRFHSIGVRFSHFLDFSEHRQHEALKNLDNRDWGITIVCYCLMPNHFHFILKQEKDGQISKFISKVSNSYSKYFNLKHNRVGPLFQGIFKAVIVESDEQLIHLSRYIHINPVTSAIIAQSEMERYSWSSYKEYLSGKSYMCEPDTVLKQFKSISSYANFVTDRISYGRELEKIKHLALEE